MRNILICGAYSAMAKEAARLFAADGDALFLAGRDEMKLKILAQDLKIRGAAKVEYLSIDLADTNRHQELLNKAVEMLGALDTVLIAHGTLGDQKKSEGSYEETERELKSNFLSAVSILIPVTNEFEKKKKGTIAVITSVAGDRGRKSNYTYGTSKAALAVYLQGLRNRLASSGVSVVTIKPGFVDTPMTAHLKKGILMASSEVAGRGIYKAIVKRKEVVYLPWFWWAIMTVIKLIPERIFKRLNL